MALTLEFTALNAITGAHTMSGKLPRHRQNVHLCCCLCFKFTLLKLRKQGC